MKYRHSNGTILDRYLHKREQIEFDKRYEESKVVKIGRKKIKELIK